MNPLLLGTREDVVGFALAGVAGAICNTADDVERAFSALKGDEIVILSPAAALLASDRIAEMQKSARGPMFVILPAR